MLGTREHTSDDCLFERPPERCHCAGNSAGFLAEFPLISLEFQKRNRMPIVWELVTPEVIARNVFVIISVPVYVLFLAVLIRFRKKTPFNSAFFRLSVATGLIDLWSIVINYFIYEYALLGITAQLLRPLLL